jgi:hypothetical protein
VNAPPAFFHTAAVGMVAISEGNAPRAVVEHARHGVGTDCRSSPSEMEQIIREAEAA